MEIKKMLLTANKYSRPGTALKTVKGIVVHYTGNPSSSAEGNRNYFESLKVGKLGNDGKYIFASSQYIVGLSGEIVQCVPENEVAYCSNSRNSDTIVMYGVVVAGLLYLVMLGAEFLTEKTNSVRDDERLREKELARIGLDIAEKAIKTVAQASVAKLEKITAKDLRLKVKSGEADKAELCALAGEAYREVVETVKPELLQELSESLHDVELYIRNQIEQQLLLLKAKLNGGAADEKTG